MKKGVRLLPSLVLALAFLVFVGLFPQEALAAVQKTVTVNLHVSDNTPNTTSYSAVWTVPAGGTIQRVQWEWYTESGYDYAGLEGFDSSTNQWVLIGSERTGGRSSRTEVLPIPNNITKVRVYVRTDGGTSRWGAQINTIQYEDVSPQITLVDDSTVGHYNQKITWEVTPGATAYELWRETYINSALAKDELLYRGPNREFVTTDQEAGRHYIYRVKAVLPSGTTEGIRAAYFTPPSAFYFTSGKYIYFSWTPGHSSNNFIIQYSTNGGATWTNLGQTGSNTEYASTLSNASSYLWRMVPWRLSNGGTLWPTMAAEFDYTTFRFATDASVTPHNQKISWGLPTADRWELWRETFRGNELIADELLYSGTSQTSFVTTDQIPNRRYFYRLRLINGSQVTDGPRLEYYSAPVALWWRDGENLRVRSTPAFSDLRYSLYYSTNGGSTYSFNTTFSGELDASIKGSVGTNWRVQLRPYSTPRGATSWPTEGIEYSPEIVFSSSGVTEFNQRISWQPLPHAIDKIELWRKTYFKGHLIDESLVYEGRANSFATVDQQPGHYYVYQARFFFDGAIIVSNELSAYNAPVAETTTDVGRIDLSWDLPHSTARFTVYRSVNGGPWQSFRVTNTGQTSLSMTDVTGDNTYGIRLEPYGLPTGASVWGVNAKGSPNLSPSLNPPSTVRINNNGYYPDRLDLTWSRGYGNTTNTVYRLTRNGSTIYEGTAITFTDTGLQPNTVYTYRVYAVNANGMTFASSADASFRTTPATPRDVQAQVGSTGWTRQNTGWVVFKFPVSDGATLYRVEGLPGGTQNFSPNVVNGMVRYHRSDLVPGNTYNVRFAARNDTGWGYWSDTITIVVPSRKDTVSPSGSLVINEGAPSTNGRWVTVRVDGTDVHSAPYRVQLSNDNSQWSEDFYIQDPMSTNLVELAGGNSALTDLGGWVAEDGIWAVTEPENGAQGGRVVKISHDVPQAGKDWGLKLDTPVVVNSGRDHTFKIRYRTANLTSGGAKLFISGTGQQDTIDLSTSDQWQELVVTKELKAKEISLKLGFDSTTNAGAVLYVDYVTLVEGVFPLEPVGEPQKSASININWELGSGATPTVYGRVFDQAGNVSAVFSDNIEVTTASAGPPRVSLKINGGADSTDSRNVLLEVMASDDNTPQFQLRMRVSNDGVYWSAWEPYSPHKEWQLPAVYGRRTVYVQVQNGALAVGSAMAQIFYLPDTAPQTSPYLTAVGGNKGSFVSGSVTYGDVYYLRVGELEINWNLNALRNVKQVRYGFDSNLSSARWETLTAKRQFSLPPWEGMKVLYAQVDTGQTYQLRFVLDPLPPKVNVSWRGGATITQPGRRATMVLEAEDNIARFSELEVSFDNGNSWQPAQPEIEVTLPGTGAQTLSVLVRDPAGNQVQKILKIFAVN